MNKPKTNSKEFFQYLLQFGLFYISGITLTLLWFELIDASFQSSSYSDGYSWMYSILSFDVAIIAVMTPAFLLLSWYSRDFIRKNPERLHIGFRRWMTYLTVFLSALTFLWFLVILISDFLMGDSTGAFVIKAVVLMIVAVCVFAYYYWDVEADPLKKTIIPVLAGCGYLLITILCILFYYLVISRSI
jgi:hypothetical protein